jgi:hypothetical protein
VCDSSNRREVTKTVRDSALDLLTASPRLQNTKSPTARTVGSRAKSSYHIKTYVKQQ